MGYAPRAADDPWRAPMTEYPPHPHPTPREFAMRSLLPLVAVLLLLSTLVIGAYAFAVAALAWWLAQSRIG